MFAPPLYSVRKFPYRDIIECNFNIQFNKKEEKRHIIQQQDNQLFRQIRLITNNYKKYNPYIVFVDIKGGRNNQENLSKLITNGFIINGKKYVISERSASMTRNAILSFIQEDIENELNERIGLGIKIEKTVLSKYVAYRGLMLSSCHCIEDWIPKIIIVPDYIRTIKNQKIKYLIDEKTTYIDKETGEERDWTQKGVETGIMDYDINVFDGTGIHHPNISYQVQERLNSKNIPTSIMWRMPFIKGVTHEVDYTTFYKENGIEFITDIWGEKHSVDDVMIIMTESMYKGMKYFKNTNTVEDWNLYWDKFKKYNYCMGVAKWNFSLEEEPIYTRANYQILQDLELPFKEFIKLARYSTSWIEKIINGDKLYTYSFLGLTMKKHEAVNDYMTALLLNSEMLKEETVRKYLISLFKKYINEMKCGKLWVKSTFKIACPDLIMLLEYIGGMDINGCLEEDEFYTKNINGVYKGEFLIERNPHLAHSEHVLLNATYNDKIARYCSHLTNICMFNGKSITLPRLNGADLDGDLVLVIDNSIMKKGVIRDIPIVIDIEDKITALEEQYNKKNLLNLILRTINSLIGETSNCATCYWNKNPSTKEQKEKYLKYIDILSVINGKAIDFAKTGVIFNIPRHIAKWAKPLPYFMKYASPYYSNLKKLAKTQTNMNRLCWTIEKWENEEIKYKHKFKDFDYKIMTDPSIGLDEEKVNQIDKIFAEYRTEIRELAKDQYKFNNYTKYKDWIQENYPTMSQEEIIGFTFNWQYYYDQYREKCKKVCPDECELANIVAYLCYEKHSKKEKSFMWKVASSGILKNLKKHKADVYLPSLSESGEYEYLGKYYNMEKLEEQ